MKVIAAIAMGLWGIALCAQPRVFFDGTAYYTPDHTAYVTIALQFSASTLQYLPLDSGAQACVEVRHAFASNDSLVLEDAYRLHSPTVKGAAPAEDFFDARHYRLPAGSYDYTLTVEDTASGAVFKGKQQLVVAPPDTTQLLLSDLVFIQEARPSTARHQLVRNGYLMLPYMTDYFPPQMEKIAFYFEAYHTAQLFERRAPLLLSYSIRDAASGQLLEETRRQRQLTPQPVIPIMDYLSLEGVPSGDYHLAIDLIAPSGDTLHSRAVFFQRRAAEYSPVNVEDVTIDEQWMKALPDDSIPYFLGSIMPISARREYETIRKLLRTDDTVAMRRYFFAFWKKTSPANASLEWFRYRQQVDRCEQLFGTRIKRAWETDRGRIWLQYGAPDQFIDRPNEPSAYPYQLWHYYRIGRRSNVRFVFYNPDLVTNDYPLLHSDMQGELQNPRWQYELHKRDNPKDDPYDPGRSIHYGGNANLHYNEIDR